ncbi:hypothetical protein LQV63_07685 [Paenibacillus profundus]|uniref:Uncharacterized protein n=1 Tax=Paenibacillus profundus TaxID=1173085 RepID=A0ABS8YB38_9BACL|nr:hypothetical protein [Paenibacillus profundus]
MEDEISLFVFVSPVAKNAINTLQVELLISWWTPIANSPYCGGGVFDPK